MSFRRSQFTFSLLLPIALVALAVGCESPAARYRLNMAFKRKIERETFKNSDPKVKPGSFTAGQTQDAADILVGLFGTPDEPNMPVVSRPDPDDDSKQIEVDGKNLVNMSAIRQASGPVGMKEGKAVGLYREHCVHCHGITGDGAGPTAAFLNPYPRDYRLGAFKFKSTKKGDKPTHDDLKQILREGIAGTAMPSFKLLDDQEVEALVDYVKYLSIRGESERALWRFAAEQDAPDSNTSELKIIDPKGDDPQKQLKDFLAQVGDIMAKWQDSKSIPVAPPATPLDSSDFASIERGKKLFYGPVANCFSCHGDSGLGDGQRDFYDDWSGEYVEKNNPAATDEYVALGALPPRNLHPRNLRHGGFRGGRRPVDLYWRIVNGIDGAQMPAAPMKPINAKGLSEADVWDLINYIRSLPYESISQGGGHEPQLHKERT